jgi:hypothetical protein
MDAANSSLELLAHFDRVSTRRVAPQPASRGVGWVLQWSAALAALVTAAALLLQFAYCLAGELVLTRAARAGVREAILPRATYRTVAHTIERRLQKTTHLGRVRLTLLQNGAQVRGALHVRGGDRLAVLLAVPADDMLPRWLRPLAWPRSSSDVEARAEGFKPGRQMTPP